MTKRASFQKNVHSDSVKESKDFSHSWVPLRLDTAIVRENIVVMWILWHARPLSSTRPIFCPRKDWSINFLPILAGSAAVFWKSWCYCWRIGTAYLRLKSATIGPVWLRRRPRLTETDAASLRNISGAPPSHPSLGAPQEELNKKEHAGSSSPVEQRDKMELAGSLS